MPRRTSHRPILLLSLLVSGCHLVDQRDFDAAAGRKPVPTVVPHAFHPPPSLVSIRYATPNPQYREAVQNAVKSALARKPDVLFTVTTLVPATGSPELQATQAATASGSGREVAQAIVDAGAAPGQVEQAVRAMPLLDVKEVHIDVH